MDQALLRLQQRANSLRGLFNSSLAVNPASATSGINAINSSLGQLQARAAALQAQFRRGFVVNSRGTAAGLNTINASARAANTSVSTLRGTLLRTFALFGAVGSVLKGGRALVDFSESIRTAGVVSGATANQLDALSQRARELGATTRFTAVEAADGITSLSRAGFTVGETLDTIGSTLSLAVAGSLGLKRATDITANALRGFNIEASDSERVVDVITAAANSATTTVEELGNALSFVAPIAAASQVSIEQTAAALDILADAGIRSSRGGTSLRIIFAALSDPSETAAAAIERLGLSIEDVDIKALGLQKVFQNLSRDQAKFGEEVFKIFDRRGAAAALALSNNTEKLQQLQDEFQGAAGSAARAAAAIDQSLLGALRRVSSAFTEIFLALGSAGGENLLGGFLDGLANTFRAVARNVDVLIDVLQTLAIFITARLIRGAFRALLSINPFVALTRGAFLAVGALAAFSDKIFVSQTSLATLQDVAITAFETIRDFAIPLFEAIGLTISNAIGGPDQINSIEDFVKAIAGGLDFARQLFTQAFIDIESSFQKVIVAIGGFTEKLFGAVANTIATVIADIIGFFAQALQKIVGASAGLVSTLASIGILSEQTRVGFEQSIAVIDKFADRRGQGGANNENLPWTKSDLDALEEETANTLREIDRLAQERSINNALDTPFTDVTNDVFARADQRARQRIQRQREEGAARKAEDERRAQALAESGTAADEATKKVANLNEEVQIATTSLADGISESYFRIATEANDFAAVSSTIIEGFADTATDALVDFAETGKFSFKDFARSILSDITRVIARLLVVQALTAALGGLGATPVDPSAALGAGSFPARAGGGPVQPNRSFLVGENGPELFTPNRGGNITPNESMSGQAPNVTVVNVDDPNMVPAAIADGGSDDAIINVISRNPDKVKRILGTK